MTPKVPPEGSARPSIVMAASLIEPASSSRTLARTPLHRGRAGCRFRHPTIVRHNRSLYILLVLRLEGLFRMTIATGLRLPLLIGHSDSILDQLWTMPPGW